MIIGHLYTNTKEQMNEITASLREYEIAYENEQGTSASIIKDIADEQAD